MAATFHYSIVDKPFMTDPDNASRAYSIWLLPGSPHRTALQTLVTDFAKLYNGHIFVPHMTLQGDLTGLPERYRPLLNEVRGVARNHALVTPPYRWFYDAVRFGDVPFRACYVDFSKNTAQITAFEELCAACRAVSGNDIGMSPFPHLSLYYGNEVPRTAHSLFQDRVARILTGAEVEFGSVALVRSSKFIPVAEWEILEQTDL